jgi:hypothetical protein
MTASTNREIVVAKRSLPVMTGGAALAAAAGVMIQRLWRRNLTPLRHARAQLVTVVTVGLRIVFSVTEA